MSFLLSLFVSLAHAQTAPPGFGQPTVSELDDKFEMNRAIQVAAQAFYIQSGYKAQVDSRLEFYEKRYLKPIEKEIPESVKLTGGTILFILRVIKDKQITLQWNLDE